MERTPSPPRRVRTPPAPLHGPKYDSYLPYSPPRRSSRVAAQQHLHQEQTQTSPTRLRSTRDVTPTSSRKKPATRALNHTLSPPSSPISPAKQRSTRRAHHDAGAIDSDSDHAAPTPARRFLSTMAPHGMLPTPNKTPRKRPLQSEESLGSTARVLFSNRPATVEDAMPTPSKIRKSNAYTLESFAEQISNAHEKIEIYTDSKERVPTRDNEEENPFIVSRTTRSKGKMKAAPPKPRDERTAKIFEAAKRGKGIAYQFRGKTILQKFDDASDSDVEPVSSGDELRRKAGPATRDRIKRSNLKPKILFQEEIERRRLENGEEDDEEAVTDIEVPIATPSRRAHKGAVSSASHATSPPPTRVKRQFSFESWSRVKSSARASSSSRDGNKRPGSPLEGAVDKRARSERSELSTSAMSIDDL